MRAGAEQPDRKTAQITRKRALRNIGFRHSYCKDSLATLYHFDRTSRGRIFHVINRASLTCCRLRVVALRAAVLSYY